MKSRAVAFALAFAAICSDASAEELIVGEPFELDEPVPGTGGGPFMDPEIAASDAGYLAVWSGWGQGSRLDPDTLEPLDPDGLPALDVFYGILYDAFVVSTGATYLVLGRDGAWEQGGHYLVGLAIDAATGEALGEPIALAPLAGGEVGALHAAAAPGGDYVVSWNAYASAEGYHGIRVARIDGDTGALLDPAEGFEVLDPASGLSEYDPFAVAADAGGALIAFTEGEAVRAVRILADGSIPDPDGFTLDGVGSVAHMDLAAAGDGFVLAWLGYQTNAAVFAALVDADAGTASAPVTLYEAPNDQIYMMGLQASADGATAGVVWWEQDYEPDPLDENVYGISLEVGTTISASERTPLSTMQGRQSEPAVASRGGEHAAVWQDQSGYTQLYGARFDGTGLLAPGDVPVGTAPNDEQSPWVAGFEEGFFTFWGDSRNWIEGGDDVFGQQVSLEGVPLGAEGLPILTGVGDQGVYDVVSLDGEPFLLWGVADESSATASLGISRLDWALGISPEIAVYDGGSNVGGAVLAALPELDELFVAYEIGTEIFGAIASPTALLYSSATPLYASPEPEPDHGYELFELQGAAFGDTALLMWMECYGMDEAEYDDWCVRRAARYDLSTAGEVAQLGDVAGAEGLTAEVIAPIGDAFQLLYVENDQEAGTATLFHRAVPADPAAPAGESEEIGPLDRMISGIYGAAPFEGGLFLSTVEFIPAEEEGSYSFGAGGIYVDGSFAMPYAPVLFEGTAFGRVGAVGDRLLHVGETRLYGSTRAVGRIVTVGEAPDAGADAGEGTSSAGCGCSANGAAEPTPGILAFLL